MAQPQLVQIKLSRFDAQPWGFRLQGGVDFASPLLVQKVNGGSLAENAGLLPGDAVIKINDVDVYNMRHKDAQDIVVRSGNNFVITVQRGGSTWRPHVAPTGAVPQPNQNSPYLQTVTKTSLAHKQQDSQHIGCGYNNAARPFTNGSGDGNVKSIVNKQYNTPVGIYSDESIAETLSAQAEVLAGGVLGVNFKKNEKEYQADKSEVLKFLREEETGHTTPAFGHSQHYQDPSQEQPYQQQPQQQQQQVYHHPIHQQQQHHQQHQQQSATRHVNAPINTPKPPSTGGLPTGQNICTECERLITGVFVRIKDKNLHVECFKCATCGTSLKNQGYYNFNNKLYCEIHAKLAAQQNPPAGTEGYVPVPIKPNTKLSANTISSALSSHGYNGVSNGNAVSSHAPAIVPSPSASVVNTLNSVENNQSIDLQKSATVASSMPYSIASNVSDEQTNSNNSINVNNNDYDNGSGSGTDRAQDQPFRYVTLTGNVIRSVMPPGKGTNINYKVNQGYARPFGAPASAPKSPVSFPPQPQQQWGASQPAAPRPAVGNSYATLPRSSIGQSQGRQLQRFSSYRSNMSNESYKTTNTTNYSLQQEAQYRQQQIPAVGFNTRRYSDILSTSCVSPPYTSYNQNYNRAQASTGAVGFKPPQPQLQPQQQPQSQAFATAPPTPQAPNVVKRASIDIDPTNDVGSAGGAGGKGGAFGATSAPKRGRGIMNKAVAPGVRVPLCNSCQTQIRGPFITALGRIWCPEHFICVNANCRRPLQDIGFVEEKGDLYCEYCFEKYLAPSCSKCNSKIKGDCLNAIGRHFHPECFTCAHCGKIFGNTPFFLEDGNPYCEADWNELFTTKCFACGFPVEAGDRWVEALNHNYHSQCFNCTYCKQNLEGQSFYNKGGRPFCKNHAR